MVKCYYTIEPKEEAMGNWYMDSVEGEVGIDEIIERANNHEFHEWNFSPFEYHESGYEDVIDELKKYKAVDYLALEDKYKKAVEEGRTVEAEGYKQQMEKMVDDVLKIYRSKNIFPIQYFSELGVMDEIEKCIAYKAKFDGNTVSCVPGNTMFFNGTRWKAISEYKEGDKVLQYNADGTASLVDPIKYIHYKSKDPFYYSGGIGITKNHNVVWLDGDKLVLNPLEKLLIDDSISDVVIPCGAVYNNKDVAGVYKSTLTRSFWAVSQNDKSSMTDYTVLLYDGRVSLSKNCLGLCLKDRIALLNMFGLNENTMRITQQSGFSHLFQYPADTIKVLYDLCSLSFNSLNFYYDNEKSHRTYYSNTFELLEVTEDAMEKVYKEDKYCFTVPSHMLVLKSSEGKVFVTGNCGAGIGTGLCRWLFPNLFDTPSAHDLTKKDAETQYKKFLNDEYLRRAIKFCYSYKDGCPTPTSVEGGLRLVGSAPSNFRPMNAKAVYERFCPKGGTIYDYCCVDSSTEFFTGSGWKYIDEYEKGDRVLQFNEDGTGELVNPIRYISYESDDPFYEFKSEWLNSCLTGNHDIVYRISRKNSIIIDKSKSLISEVYGGRKNGKYYTSKDNYDSSRKYLYKKIKQEEILNEYFSQQIPLTFEGKGDSFMATDDELKLLAYCHNTMSLLDGDVGLFAVYIDTEQHLNKLTRLLEDMYEKNEIFEYTYGISDNKSNGYIVEFVYEKLLKYLNKGFCHINRGIPSNSYSVLNDRLYFLEKECSMKFAEYICDWYGEKYSTRSEHNSNVVQYMFVSNGCGAYIKTQKCGKGLANYVVHIGENDQVGYYKKTTSKSAMYKVINKKKKYCFEVPSHMLILRRNGKVFITGNCGFGGRMLGALSSKNNYKYVGTDPCTETMYHLHELGDYIEMVTGREDSYELHCCGSEVFRGPANSIDFAFSSPPYFNLEVYSDEPTQCYNKFPKLEEWLEGYVRATIKNIHHMLKPGHFYAVNIADFKVGGGGEVAYVDEWKRISAEEGMPLFDTVYLGVTARAGSAEQAAGELKKENIMIFKKPL